MHEQGQETREKSAALEAPARSLSLEGRQPRWRLHDGEASLLTSYDRIRAAVLTAFKASIATVRRVLDIAGSRIVAATDARQAGSRDFDTGKRSPGP
jgi:hypothetical protein